MNATQIGQVTTVSLTLVTVQTTAGTAEDPMLTSAESVLTIPCSTFQTEPAFVYPDGVMLIPMR